MSVHPIERNHARGDRSISWMKLAGLQVEWPEGQFSAQPATLILMAQQLRDLLTQSCFEKTVESEGRTMTLLIPPLLLTVMVLGLSAEHRDAMAAPLNDPGVEREPAPPLGQVAARQSKSESARRLYDRIMQEYRQRDYRAALAGFEFFLAIHGKSSLAPSARYWMGECQYRLGRYEAAMNTFSELVSYYPVSPKITATTLKIGLTYSKLGQQEEARITLERVISEWPDTVEADVARKELAKYSPTGDRDVEP
ncbi:MAG: tol-pal system protein YbgF [Nitrospiraceae bacterium]